MEARIFWEVHGLNIANYSIWRLGTHVELFTQGLYQVTKMFCIFCFELHRTPSTTRFDSLYLMSTAIRSSFGILGWTAALLFLIQMLFALVRSLLLECFSSHFQHLNRLLGQVILLMHSKANSMAIWPELIVGCADLAAVCSVWVLWYSVMSYDKSWQVLVPGLKPASLWLLLLDGIAAAGRPWDQGQIWTGSSAELGRARRSRFFCRWNICTDSMSMCVTQGLPNAKVYTEVYTYFGTFSRALLTMFEITLASWLSLQLPWIQNHPQPFPVAFLWIFLSFCVYLKAEPSLKVVKVWYWMHLDVPYFSEMCACAMRTIIICHLSTVPIELSVHPPIPVFLLSPIVCLYIHIDVCVSKCMCDSR